MIAASGDKPLNVGKRGKKGSESLHRCTSGSCKTGLLFGVEGLLRFLDVYVRVSNHSLTPSLEMSNNPVDETWGVS